MTTGSKLYRTSLDSTTSAVSWDISEGDDFDVPRIMLNFSAPVSTAEDLTVTIVDATDSNYDMTIRTYNVVGMDSVSIEGICGVANGDTVRVEFTNTDALTIRGKAVVQL